MKFQFQIASLGLIALMTSATIAQQATTPVAPPVAPPEATSESSSIAAWSDATWDAARRADMATFENKLANAPTGNTVSLKALQEAIALRAQHQVEQEKIRQESIATRRKELTDDLAKDNLSKAMVAAANLKFLLDNDDWKLELKSDAVIQVQAKGQATYLQALKDSDWLLAQEMLFRLRALHEDGGDPVEFKNWPINLMIAATAFNCWWSLRPSICMTFAKTNDRLKAMEALDPKVDTDPKDPSEVMDPNDPEGELSAKASDIFPEYNPALVEPWKDQLQGVTLGILKEALRKTATEHIENCGWQPLIMGGIEALKLLATTDECRESFPNLADATKRGAWIAAIDKAAASVSSVKRESVNGVLFREVITQLLLTNQETVELPEEVVLHQFGEGAMGVLSRHFEDNYSSLIWPESLRRFRQQVDGNFVGVGIMIRHDEKRDIQIVNPLEWFARGARRFKAKRPRDCGGWPKHNWMGLEQGGRSHHGSRRRSGHAYHSSRGNIRALRCSLDAPEHQDSLGEWVE